MTRLFSGSGRPRSLIRGFRAGPLLLLGILGLVRCSFDEGPNPREDEDAGAGARSPQTHDEILLSFGDPSTGNDKDRINALCGSGACVPDDPDSCHNVGGMGGMTNGPSLGGAAGGVSYDPGDSGVSGMACRVTDRDCPGGDCSPVRRCLEEGVVEEGQPCTAPSDCAAGLSCVADGAAGVCRPYCCEGTSASCSKDTFCDERPLIANPSLYVPVCIPVDNCPLTDPFPCQGEDCACQGAAACIVVRDDGSTACTQPGAGRAGDPCSVESGDGCAHGFVCSPTAGCMQLCSTVATTSSCPEGGTCQHPAKFPQSLGLCVGLAGDSQATR